jgi:integrase
VDEGAKKMSIWTDKDGRKHVGLMVNGKRLHHICPAGTTARDAKRIEAELRGTLTAVASAATPSDPPLSSVMDLYLAHLHTLRSPDTARYHALRIAPWTDRYTASTAAQCAAMIAQDMAGAYATATINRSLGTLKKAITLAWERGLIPENYGARIKRQPENNERHIYLSINDVNHLTSFASESVAAAIWIALFTGCRRGEIMKLSAQDVGNATITIHAANTKTLKTRTIPIIGPLRRWLPFIPMPINSEGLKSGFRRAREKAGLPDLHFHDLRHSCASILLASGADLYTISRILGHSSTKMTERYTHLQVGAQEAALERAFGDITQEITQDKKKGAKDAS